MRLLEAVSLPIELWGTQGWMLKAQQAKWSVDFRWVCRQTTHYMYTLYRRIMCVLLCRQYYEWMSGSLGRARFHKILCLSCAHLSFENNPSKSFYWSAKSIFGWKPVVFDRPTRMMQLEWAHIVEELTVSKRAQMRDALFDARWWTHVIKNITAFAHKIYFPK